MAAKGVDFSRVKGQHGSPPLRGTEEDRSSSFGFRNRDFLGDAAEQGEERVASETLEAAHGDHSVERLGC